MLRFGRGNSRSSITNTEELVLFIVRDLLVTEQDSPGDDQNESKYF